MFRHMIDGWSAEYTPAYNAFIKALLLDGKKAINVYMKRTALATFSFFDVGNKPSETTEPERFSSWLCVRANGRFSGQILYHFQQGEWFWAI